MNYTEQEYREAASMVLGDSRANVDDDAPVSMGDSPGAYVQAWVWVGNLDMRMLGYPDNRNPDDDDDDEGG